MSGDKGDKRDSEKTAKDVVSKGPNIVSRLGLRTWVIVGLFVIYAILMVAVPAGDPKGLTAIFILLVIVFVMVSVDQGYIGYVRFTGTTLGLVVGVTGLAVGLFALILGSLASNALYTMLALIYLILFTPLFVYKVVVIHAKGHDYVHPLKLVGSELLLLSIALFFLSTDATVTVVDIVVFAISMWIRGKGVSKQNRKAELEKIAAPS